jgi:hypothetical protein
MAIQTHFDKFDKAIYLTSQSDGYKKAKEKNKGILKVIKEKFKEAGFPVIEDFLQGSFPINTAIISLGDDYDIDQSIVISATNAPSDPVLLKLVILDVLEKRSFIKRKVKMPCVTADYTSINLHIDYTVYKKDINGNYKLAVGKVGSSDEIKEWSDSDTKGLLDWIVSTNGYGENATNKRKQFKRLVRYMKRWRDNTFSDEVRNKIFSIALTVMIKEQYKPYFTATEVESDLVVLKKVIDNILSAGYLKVSSYSPIQYRVSVLLPKEPCRDIFQHNSDGNKIAGSDQNIGTQLKNKLTLLTEKLQNTLDEGNEIEQCKVLNKIFGSDFKIPKESPTKSSHIVSSASTIFASAGATGTSQGAL